jgi:hypothetical protein
MHLYRLPQRKIILPNPRQAEMVSMDFLSNGRLWQNAAAKSRHRVTSGAHQFLQTIHLVTEESEKGRTTWA